MGGKINDFHGLTTKQYNTLFIYFILFIYLFIYLKHFPIIYLIFFMSGPHTNILIKWNPIFLSSINSFPLNH